MSMEIANVWKMTEKRLIDEQMSLVINCLSIDLSTNQLMVEDPIRNIKWIQ